MATDHKDIELRIRARDYSQKTLDELVATLNELTDAQKQQQEAAKRGEVSASALEASYKRLESVGKALVSQHNLTELFSAQSRALDEAAAKTETARQRQQEFAASLASTENVTRKQQTELNKLARAVVAAEKEQQRASDRLDVTTGRLERQGIASNRLVESQQKIAQSVRTVNQSLERQDAALDTVEDDLRRAKAATDAKAAADRQAAQAIDAAVKMSDRLASAGRKIIAQAEAEAKAQEEVRASLNAAADEAIGMAKGYDTLARSVNNLRTDTLSKAVRGIADPAGEAVKNLDGMTSAVDRLEKQIGAINGPIRDHASLLNQLKAVQKSVSDVAGLIDSYRQQEEAVERARVEYEAARSAVERLAREMRSSGGDVNTLGNRMRSAQTRLRAASNEMQRQSQTASDMATRLRDAGVATDNLAAAEQRVVSNAERARRATEQLTEAYRKYGVEVRRASDNATFKWVTGGRTTLSYMQRIRGEVLSLAAAYVGLQSGINLARGALEAYRKEEAIKARLTVMVGDDIEAIEAEWRFLEETSDRLGFSFEEMSMAYSKFGVAAIAANMPLEETRYVFTKMAEAARGAKLSSESFGLAMLAVEQMISKGKISMEELRKQLGEHLPGAFAIAAAGVGMTVEEFSRHMERTGFGSELVINLARQAAETYSQGLEVAVDSMVAAEGRLESAIFHFQRAVAHGGMAEAYREFIVDLTDFLNSNEGEQLAQLLSDAFKAIIRMLQWAAENTELLKAAFAGFIGLQVAKTIYSWVPAVTAFSRAIVAMVKWLRSGRAVLGNLPKILDTFSRSSGRGVAALGNLTQAFRLLGRALLTVGRFLPVIGPILTGGTIAYSIYKALRGRKGDAEEAGREVGEEFAKGMSEGIADPGTGITDSSLMREALRRTVEQENERTAKLLANAQMKQAKDDLDERERLVAEPFEMWKQQARAHITDQQELADTIAMIDDALNRRLEAERARYDADHARSNERAAERRIRLAQEVADELERIEDDLAQRGAKQDANASFEERMATRVAAVSHEYNRLLKKVRELGELDAKAAAEAEKRVEAYIRTRQELESVAVRQEELSRLEGQLNQQIQVRAAQMQLLNTEYETGLIDLQRYRNELENINLVQGNAIVRAGDSVRLFAETMKDVLDPAAYTALMARISSTMATHNATLLNQRQDLANAEQDLNLLIAERDRIVEAYVAKFNLGLTTEREMVDAVNDTNDAYRERIVLAAEAVQAAAEAIAAEGDAAATEMAPVIEGARRTAEEVGNAKQEVTELQRVMASSILENAVSAFDSMAESIANVVTGQASIRDMFADMGVAAAKFFADFLRDIAIAMIRMQLLNAMKAQGGWMGAAATAMGVQAHGGAVVGAPGGHTRRVDASWFAGAPRFHNGGLPGLQPNEVPAILERGEEVLARDDPRNILNGGGSSGGGSARFVLVDDRSRVAEAMAGAEGEKVTMVHLRRNIPTLKQLLR